MHLTLDLLDGTYRVHIHSTDSRAALPDGDNETVIHNGMTFRKDSKGFIWESSFTILNSHQVGLLATVDPSHGAADAFVIDDAGNPTKGMVTYRCTLDARLDGGTLVLQGDIHHAGGVTNVTFTKIS